MAVPRNRHSNSRRNTKRAHHAKVAKNLNECKNCGKPHMPHRACMSCGHYSGRSLLPEQAEG
jgi:large subunit ribosomal protein L32